MIIMGVLTYFVYRPILNLLDQRRERVRKAMEEAARIDGQAKEMEKIRQEHLKKIDQESGAFLERAKRDAEQVKKEILDSANREAAAMITKTQQQLEEQRGRMVSELQESVAGIAVRLAEKILEKEFTPADQQRILKGVERDVPALLK